MPKTISSVTLLGGKMFTNFKLRTKLLAGFGFVLILLLLVIGIYQFAMSMSVSGFSGLVAEEIAIQSHAQTAEAFMLQCRRNEKDFLLRKDMKYLDKFQSNLEKVVANADAIVPLAQTVGDAEITELAKSIKGAATRYRSSFYDLLAAWEKRGLDHESGLQGTFRKIVKSAEADLQVHQIQDLYIDFLLMRRWEKDFHRIGSDKYRKRMTATQESFKNGIDSKNKTESLEVIANDFDRYRAAFSNFASTGENYEGVRGAAGKLEKSIKDIFVPDVKGLLLMVRRGEKDYLLRGSEKYVKKTHASLEKLYAAFENSDVDRKYVENTARVINEYKIAFDALVEIGRAHV